MLCDLHAAGSRYERRSRGDIKTVCVVAASANDFKYVKRGRHFCGVRPHSGGTARDFLNGFGARALCGEGGKKCGVLCRGGFPAHDFVHHGVGFVVGEVFFIDNFLNGFFNHRASLL